MKRTTIILVGLTLALAISSPAFGFVTLVPDFRVDQSALYSSRYPRVAVDGNDNFIVTWRHYFNEIYARRFDYTGSPLGPEFLVYVGFSDSDHPDIDTDSANNFIITWLDWGGGYDDIFARRFNSDGDTLGPTFQVDQDPGGGDKYDPRIAVNSNNRFIITWEDHRSGDEDIYARAYDANGNPLGNEFRVDSGGTSTAGDPQIASNNLNNFMIVWWDDRSASFDIYARLYDNNGDPLGADFRIDPAPSGGAYLPSIAADGNNNFVIAWSDNRDGNWNIYACRFDSTGAPLGSDFRVDQDAGAAWALYAEVAVDADNKFIIVWQDHRGSYYTVYARRYDSSGNPLEDEFRVDNASWTANRPTVIADSNNDWFFTWYDIRFSPYHVYASIWGEDTGDGTPPIRVAHTINASFWTIAL
jgi:hypothetical protein